MKYDVIWPSISKLELNYFSTSIKIDIDNVYFSWKKTQSLVHSNWLKISDVLIRSWVNRQRSYVKIRIINTCSSPLRRNSWWSLYESILRNPIWWSDLHSKFGIKSLGLYSSSLKVFIWICCNEMVLLKGFNIPICHSIHDSLVIIIICVSDDHDFIFRLVSNIQKQRMTCRKRINWVIRQKCTSINHWETI